MSLGPSVEDLLPSDTSTAVVLVAHRVGSDIQSEADRLSGVLHVATSLHDVLWGDLKGCWTVLLLKVA